MDAQIWREINCSQKLLFEVDFWIEGPKKYSETTIPRGENDILEAQELGRMRLTRFSNPKQRFLVGKTNF